MTERSVEHATITIQRVFEAGPARVFAAWSDAKAKRRWFVGGEGWEIGGYELDFRVGGREQGSFRQTDGPMVHNDTVYLDIVPDQRIVFAYSMAGEAGPFSASLATVVLTPEGAGTRLVFTEQGAFLDGRDQPKYREQGWGSLLDALGEELSGGSAAA